MTLPTDTNHLDSSPVKGSEPLDVDAEESMGGGEYDEGLEPDFKEALSDLLNQHGVDARTHTKDSTLADFLIETLNALSQMKLQELADAGAVQEPQTLEGNEETIIHRDGCECPVQTLR